MKIKFGKTFDWFAVLERLNNGETISEGDYLRLGNMASDWPACACGQLCKQLPRDSLMCPLDTELRERGTKFADYVCGKQWAKALNCFNKIEARSAKLLGLKFVPRHPVTSKEKPFAVTMGRNNRVSQETRNREYA